METLSASISQSSHAKFVVLTPHLLRRDYIKCCLDTGYIPIWSCVPDVACSTYYPDIYTATVFGVSLCSGPAVSWDLIFHGPLPTNFLFEHNMGNVVAMIKWVVRCKDEDITQQPPLFRALVRSRPPACTCSASSPGPRQCSCPPRTRGKQRVNIFTEQQIFSSPRPGRTTWRGCGGCRPPRCRCPGWRGAGAGRPTPCTPSPAAAGSPPARCGLEHQYRLSNKLRKVWCDDEQNMLSWTVNRIGEIPQEFIF